MVLQAALAAAVSSLPHGELWVLLQQCLESGGLCPHTVGLLLDMEAKCAGLECVTRDLWKTLFNWILSIALHGPPC